MMKDKKVLVFGMARSGIAAAKLLLLRGARVWVCDAKAEAEFDGALDDLKAAGATLCLGEKEPEKLLKGMDALIVSPGIPVEHPAVVNPAVSADVGGSVMSLRGEWEFLAQPMAKPIHYGGPWGPKLYRAGQEWPGARKIEVPGCWEAQGVGEQGMSESWDPKWDNSEKPIRSKYMGDGWYRRKVVIPASWEGRRIWLKVGGVKSRGWFWVNDGEVALVDNFCGTCKYEITDLVKPGEEALVVAQVNNALPSRRGCVSGMHKWGGFYRDVEIDDELWGGRRNINLKALMEARLRKLPEWAGRFSDHR